MIRFTVPAVPIAQPRPRAVMGQGGHARVHEVTHIKNNATGQRKPHPIAAFKATARLSAQNAYKGPPISGPVVLRLLFLMPRPGRLRWKSRPMPRIWHTTKPDLDNLEKAIKDALSGLVWIDDCQVCEVRKQKLYCRGDEQPGLLVEIEEAEPWLDLKEGLFQSEYA